MSDNTIEAIQALGYTGPVSYTDEALNWHGEEPLDSTLIEAKKTELASATKKADKISAVKELMEGQIMELADGEGGMMKALLVMVFGQQYISLCDKDEITKDDELYDKIISTAVDLQNMFFSDGADLKALVRATTTDAELDDIDITKQKHWNKSPKTDYMNNKRKGGG